MPDIRETLAALDQRLADLKNQITDLASTSDPAPPPPPPARRPLPPPAAIELEGEQGSAGPPVLDSERAQQIAEGVDQLGAQIEQLLTMRERLLGDARDVLNRYQGQLDELARQDPSGVQAAVSWLAAPTATPTPTPPVDATGARSDLEDGASRPAFFEGIVGVTVSGATRIQTVQVLEDALSRIQNVEQVYIRRWHAGTLWLELSVSGGVELIGELNRVFPFPFAVQAATGHEILVTLEGEL